MKNEKAIENFLNTIDLTLPKQAHFENAILDSRAYLWSKETLIEILKGIERSYKSIKKGK